MTRYLIRIYDRNLRTNYIERVIEATDGLDALEKAKSDADIAREAKGKLSVPDSLAEMFSEGHYELSEIG